MSDIDTPLYLKGDIVIIKDGTFHELLSGEKIDLSGKIGLIELWHFEDMANKTGAIMYHVKHFVPPVGGVCLPSNKIKLAENPESMFFEICCAITGEHDSCTSPVFFLKRDYALFDGLFIPKNTKAIIVREIDLVYCQAVLFFGKKAVFDLVEISALERVHNAL